MGELSANDTALLDFEGQPWASAGRKETAMREMLAMSPTAYYQRLNALLDDEAALAARPMLVGRLRRLRDR